MILWTDIPNPMFTCLIFKSVIILSAVHGRATISHYSGSAMPGLWLPWSHWYETWFANDCYRISKWRHRSWSRIINGYFSWYWRLFAWQYMVHESVMLCPYMAHIIYISTQPERTEKCNTNLRWDLPTKSLELCAAIFKIR